jgi:hypothetical protein
MADIQVVTPEIDADEFMGFPLGFVMIFQINNYQVRAVVTEPGEETEYSIVIRGIYADRLYGRTPNAEDAQHFLYKTILDGIFVSGDFEVVSR